VNSHRAIALCALIAGCSRGSTRLAPHPVIVQPPAAYTSADVPLVIAGDHFEPRAVEQVGGGGGVQVDAAFRAFLGNVELQDVQWQSINRLTATAPHGLEGAFDLLVVGPTGEGTLVGAFRGTGAAPAALSASLSAPAAALRGDTFTVTLTASNSGSLGVNGLSPILSVSGTGSPQIVSGPVPASQDLAGGGIATFSWACSGAADGSAALSATVSGSDALDGSPRSASASSTVSIFDALQLADAPLGTSTTFAYVFDFNGRVYLGPSQNGTGGVRMMPDGSNAEPFSLTFNADSVNNDTNGAAKGGNFPSLGVTGCSSGTLFCGPDNENGRGLFGSGVIGGVPWLIASGARTADTLRHVYATSDTGTAPAFSYAYIANAVSAETRGTSSMLVFHDRLYLGFPDTGPNRPTYIVLRKTPPSPGFSPATGTDVVNLRVNVISGFGAGAPPSPNAAAMQMIDSQAAFNDLLYAANNGGIIRSTNNDPQPASPPTDWTTATPGAPAYGSKTSMTISKTVDLEPADKAFPQLAVLGGKLYAARNTTAGPQLWVCAPGPNLACDPPDWTLLAPNDVGDPTLSQFDDPQNAAVTLLVATSTRLYVGYNNASGLVLYRSRGNAPSSRADFEGAGSCDASTAPASCDGLGGRGLGVGATRIFDGRALTYGGTDYVYLTAGTGNAGFKVYRLLP